MHPPYGTPSADRSAKIVSIVEASRRIPKPLRDELPIPFTGYMTIAKLIAATIRDSVVKIDQSVAIRASDAAVRTHNA